MKLVVSVPEHRLMLAVKLWVSRCIEHRLDTII